jgi:heme/copper-type cytochrome/quinol oxidase subunit 3
MSIPEATAGDHIEPPELVVGNLRGAARLAVAATTFVFFVPFFAYFYLRSLNSAGLWRPAGVDPPLGLGLAIMVCFAGSGVALSFAAAWTTAKPRVWKPLTGCSLVLGIAGIALQIVEWAALPFGTSAGGYASVFIGWTLLTTVLALATMFSIAPELAYGLRHRDAPLAVVQPRLLALAFYWAYLAGLSVAMWIVLYAL